ncbi:MAG: hypothetical protein AAFY38_15240 [Pseudomonadota bacterium]
MGNWDELVRVTQVQYAKTQQGLAPILAKEAQLRSELARLDAHDQAARHETRDLSSVRAIGADVVWNSWLTRKRRMLTTELAQVLAHKEMRLGQVRRDQARQDVAQQMARDDASRTRARQHKRSLDEAVSLHVLRKMLDQ